MKGPVFGAFCLASLLFSTPYAVTPLSAQGLRLEPDVSIDWQRLDALIPRRSISDPVDPTSTEAIPQETASIDELLKDTPPEEPEPMEAAPVEPVSVEPEQVENQLAELDQEETMPDAPEEPAPEEPAPEESEPAEPTLEEPVPEEPAPKESEPAEPAPEEPAPEESEPAEPTLEEPVPEEPAPKESKPAEPAPEEPAPAEPAPEEPAPEEPAPEESEPAEPAPAEPAPDAPVEPAPAEPAPDAPVEPAPAEPAPEQPEPEESAPEQPEPEESIPEEATPDKPENILSKYPQLAGFPPYIIFSLDQLVLTQAHRRALDPFADLLKDQPVLRLRLHSLADDRTKTYQKIPSSTSGKVLRAAVSRARSVENYLVEKGIDEARIEIITTEQSGPAAHQNRVEFDFHD